MVLPRFEARNCLLHLLWFPDALSVFTGSVGRDEQTHERLYGKSNFILCRETIADTDAGAMLHDSKNALSAYERFQYPF